MMKGEGVWEMHCDIKAEQRTQADLNAQTFQVSDRRSSKGDEAPFVRS